MNSAEARRAIEGLRKGVPPDGQVRLFTVGRETEIEDLRTRIASNAPGALLLRANYGAGKSHLLKYIRELALAEGYAVSLMSLDARAAVRFNRMDQILGAAIRNIEVPGSGHRGPGALLAALLEAMTESCPDPTRRATLDELCNMGEWDYSTTLRSPALFVAVRAWIIGTMYESDHGAIPKEVEAWLCEPWNYYSRTKWLYERFVAGLRGHFCDRRVAWQFYRRGCDTFILNAADYRQSWDALSDLDLIAKLSGLRGLVLLVDEFEDVIYNLGRIDHQFEAFWNLFRLFDGEYPGMSFYAVTPAFSKKCKKLLMQKGYGDYDYSRFDALPTFEMSPLGTPELTKLAVNIIETHGLAYGWEPDLEIMTGDLRRLVENTLRVAVEDRVRQTIRVMVSLLDQTLEEAG